MATSTLSLGIHNSRSRKQGEIRCGAIKVNGHEMAAKQGRNSARSASGVAHRLECQREEDME